MITSYKNRGCHRQLLLYIHVKMQIIANDRARCPNVPEHILI